MRRVLLIGFVACLAVALAAPVAADGVTAAAAFEKLSSLEGTWTGSAAGEGEEAAAEAENAGEIVFDIKLSAAGTVVMETMGPGSPQEMINMYHVDGEDLLLTHYCAGGNQPRMRLDREASTADMLVFAYDGGTNHDPAVDEHIHSAAIRLVDADQMVSAWTAHAGGQEAGKMTFRLARSE